jgi:hypothetical protein
MTKYFVRQAGKMLFPHLAYDQRKQRLSNIMLVFLTSVVGNGVLVVLMLRHGHRLF